MSKHKLSKLPLKEQFKFVDQDQDGKLDLHEIQALCAVHFPDRKPNWCKSFSRRLMVSMDKDADGADDSTCGLLRMTDRRVVWQVRSTSTSSRSLSTRGNLRRRST